MCRLAAQRSASLLRHHPAHWIWSSRTGLSGTLSGWQVGDVIDFVSTSVTSAGISGSTLTVTVSGGTTFTYQLAGQEANTSASTQSDGAGGIDVILVSGPPTVSSGQTLVVSSGQTSNGIVVLSGGTVDVLSGGATSTPLLPAAAPRS